MRLIEMATFQFGVIFGVATLFCLALAVYVSGVLHPYVVPSYKACYKGAGPLITAMILLATSVGLGIVSFVLMCYAFVNS